MNWDVIIGLACLALCVPLWWSLHCTFWAHRQRMAMLHAMTPGHDFCWPALRLFDQVSCAEHERALFWFKDPRKLYDPRLLEMIHVMRADAVTSPQHRTRATTP